MSDPNSGPVPPVPPPGEPVTPPPAPPGPPLASEQPPAYAQPAYAQPAPAATKTLSLIGMIAGIVGLVGFPVVFIPIVGSIMGLFIPAAAIVLGFLGRKREGVPAKPFWLTALITGFVGIAIALIALIGWIVIIAAAGTYGFDSYNY